MGKSFLRRVAGGLDLSKLAGTTAAPAHVVSPYTFYSKNKELKTGTITSKAAATYGAKTSAQTIKAGQYLSGDQTIAAVTQTNLAAANIIKGKTVTIKSNGVNLWNIAGTASAQTAENSASEIVLLDGTNQYNSVTSSWIPYDNNNSQSSRGSSTFSANSDSTGLQLAGETMCRVVNLTNISTIKVTMSVDTANEYSKAHCGLHIQYGTNKAYTLRVAQVNITQTGKKEYTLDVSSLSGVYSLALRSYNAAYTMTFYNVTLVK